MNASQCLRKFNLIERFCLRTQIEKMIASVFFNYCKIYIYNSGNFLLVYRLMIIFSGRVSTNVLYYNFVYFEFYQRLGKNTFQISVIMRSK